jgi:hypothetical protein
LQTAIEQVLARYDVTGLLHVTWQREEQHQTRYIVFVYRISGVRVRNVVSQKVKKVPLERHVVAQGGLKG